MSQLAGNGGNRKWLRNGQKIWQRISHIFFPFLLATRFRHKRRKLGKLENEARFSIKRRKKKANVGGEKRGGEKREEGRCWEEKGKEVQDEKSMAEVGRVQKKVKSRENMNKAETK